jgi:hypothetical protein
MRRPAPMKTLHVLGRTVGSRPALDPRALQTDFSNCPDKPAQRTVNTNSNIAEHSIVATIAAGIVVIILQVLRQHVTSRSDPSAKAQSLPRQQEHTQTHKNHQHRANPIMNMNQHAIALTIAAGKLLTILPYSKDLQTMNIKERKI